MQTYLSNKATDWLAGAYFSAANDAAPAGKEYSPTAAAAAIEEAGPEMVRMTEAAEKGDEDAAERISLWLSEPDSGAWTPIRD